MTKCNKDKKTDKKQQCSLYSFCIHFCLITNSQIYYSWPIIVKNHYHFGGAIRAKWGKTNNDCKKLFLLKKKNYRYKNTTYNHLCIWLHDNISSSKKQLTRSSFKWANRTICIYILIMKFQTQGHSMWRFLYPCCATKGYMNYICVAFLVLCCCISEILLKRFSNTLGLMLFTHLCINNPILQL